MSSLSENSEDDSRSEDKTKNKKLIIDFFSSASTTPKPTSEKKTKKEKTRKEIDVKPKKKDKIRDNVKEQLELLRNNDEIKAIKDPPLKDLKAVRFGIIGPDEIQGIATCKITKSNITNPHLETVYDERMGPADTKSICASCSQPIRVCPGHFGYIELATPVINPQFIKTIVSILNCVCLTCSKIRMSKEELQIELETTDLSSVSSQEIHKLCNDIPQCRFCEQPIPSVAQQESKIYKIFADKLGKKRSLINVNELLTILKKISDEDIILMGYKINYRECNRHNTIKEKIPSFRPEYMIITHLPVLPSVSRPPNFEGGMRNNDDLTSSYVEIIKNNQKIYECANEKDREDRINILESYICSFIDNTDETTKHTSGKPIKSVKERLAGKDALIRGKIMGKRVDVSARTVITADTTLDIDEVGVPYEICEKLTKPEEVTYRTIGRLNKMLEDGKINMIKRDDKLYMIMSYFKSLKIGDKVYRHLSEGDNSAMNRQPTLHRGGIMGHKVVPMPGKTFRLNLAVTASYGADFNF